MSRAAWVVGATGLLGRAITRALRSADLIETVIALPMDWSDPARFDDQVVSALGALAKHEELQLYWCAGTATVGTSQRALDSELAQFTHFLSLVESAGDRPHRTAVFYASSAGGVYAGSTAPPFDENTVAAPISPYGRAKIAAEERLRVFAARSGIPVFIGRISNLYGPDQNLAKAQGVISQLCKSSITRIPASIYVSLDTTRDYIYADDCAFVAVRAMERMSDGPVEGRVVTKILASRRPTSIAAIIGTFTSASPLRPHAMIGSSPHSVLQVRDLRLKSVVWPDLDRYASTPLVVGIDAISRSMMLSYANGTLL